MKKPLLALDFDGVLHSYVSGWEGARTIPDPPVPGAIEFLVGALDHFDVAIHSSRARYFGGRWAMKRWLRHHLTEFRWAQSPKVYGGHGLTAMDMEEGFQAWASEVIARIAFPLWKPPAHLTIDDRALTFVGEWPTIDALKEFKPWNKR